MKREEYGKIARGNVNRNECGYKTTGDSCSNVFHQLIKSLRGKSITIPLRMSASNTNIILCVIFDRH